MTEEEFVNYWFPATQNLFKSSSIHDRVHNTALENFLKCKEYTVYYWTSKNHDKQMPAEIARKVQLLSGPHWRTVLKANGVGPEHLGTVLQNAVPKERVDV